MNKKIIMGIIAILAIALFIAGCGDEKKVVNATPSEDAIVYEVNTTTNETTIADDADSEPTIEEMLAEMRDEEASTDEPEEILASEEDFEIVEAGGEHHRLVNVTSEKTTYGTYNNISHIDETSLFVIDYVEISTASEDAGYRANVAKDDDISFTITNRDEHEYYITYMRPKDSTINYGLKITVNGHRIDDIEDACGSKYIKPDQTLKCSGFPALIKKGFDVRFHPYINILKAEGNFMNSQLFFTVLDDDEEPVETNSTSS